MIRLGVDVPARTVDTPVVQWIDGVDDALAVGLTHRNPVLGVAAEMVRLGVAPGDLLAFSLYLHGTQKEIRHAPREAAFRLAKVLKWRYNHGGLRAGIGWALIDRYDTPWEWQKAGLVEEGWRFAAAGLSPNEALAMIETGSVDRDRLSFMAAMRGVALPVE